jgi:hypothetical protein
MEKSMRFAFVMTFLFLLAHVSPAQDNAAASAVPLYRLRFAVHEMEDSRRVDTKNYSMLLEEKTKGVIKIGTKVPVQTGTAGGSTQFTYVDVGMNLDCRLVEMNRGVRLYTDVELSNVSQESSPKFPAQPIIRQIRSSGEAVLSPGKATPLATLDDPATKRHYEIEVTATKLQ